MINPLLLDELRKPGANILFVTGAGISIASGIPPFRGKDPGAVWNKDVIEKGRFEYFLKHPDKSWLWYLDTFAVHLGAQPNAAHTAITELEMWLEQQGSMFDLVTQNVDGLHGKAGTQNVIECHGAIRNLRCTTLGCTYGPPTGVHPWEDSIFDDFRANPCPETAPKCPACGNLFRPHTLLFDESYSGHDSYGLDTIDDLMQSATTVVFAGTSFAVTITDLVMTYAYQRGIPMFNIDPTLECVDGMYHIQEGAETFLPALMKELLKGDDCLGELV